MGSPFPAERTSPLIEGSSGGRPGRRERRRRRVDRSSRCHRVSVSGRTTTLLHRSRDSKRAAVARNARSAVVKRGRVPPDRGSSAGGGARPSRDPAHRRRTGRADGAGRKGAGTAQTRAPRQSELSRWTCPPTARSEPRSSFFTPRAIEHRGLAVLEHLDFSREVADRVAWLGRYRHVSSLVRVPVIRVYV